MAGLWKEKHKGEEKEKKKGVVRQLLVQQHRDATFNLRYRDRIKFTIKNNICMILLFPRLVLMEDFVTVEGRKCCTSTRPLIYGITPRNQELPALDETFTQLIY